MTAKSGRRYALIGDPVAHSLSPLIHNTAFRLLGIDARYDALTVPAGDISRLPNIVAQYEIHGFNVTVPHKESVIPFLQEMDAVVRAVGAVNTVRLADHRWTGFNTDVKGFSDSLRSVASDREGGGAVVLGAGGSARAVAFALLNEFQYEPVVVINRTRRRAEEIANRFHNRRLRTATWSDIDFRVRLLVNCTTQGLHGEKIDIPSAVWSQRPVIMDLIYHTVTPLISEAADRGCRTLDGLDMLIRQAAESFRIWIGQDMPIEEVRSTLRLKSFGS
jgi:shikimate dehydrogenase